MSYEPWASSPSRKPRATSCEANSLPQRVKGTFPVLQRKTTLGTVLVMPVMPFGWPDCSYGGSFLSAG